MNRQLPPALTEKRSDDPLWFRIFQATFLFVWANIRSPLPAFGILAFCFTVAGSFHNGEIMTGVLFLGLILVLAHLLTNPETEEAPKPVYIVPHPNHPDEEPAWKITQPKSRSDPFNDGT